MQKTEFVWFDGKLVPWDEATVHVGSQTLHYGPSVFEGIRAYELPDGPAVFCLDAHLDRMWVSCKVLGIELPYSREDIHKAILDTIRANGHKSCYIRPIAFKGWGSYAFDLAKTPTHVAVMTSEMGKFLGPDALDKGVAVGVSSWRRAAPDTYPAAAKIGGQYVSSILINRESRMHGYAESISLDVNGYISEGSGENVFLVRRGRLITPSLSTGILDGITRQCIFVLADELGLEVEKGFIPRELLYMADEVFFCGTAVEITPVCSVDGLPVGEGKRGPVTLKLMDMFFDIVEGRVPDRHGWLTPVG
jgi:branched-chain amino acid aminotransferase